ncbi:MAG: protoporphyrinogen oxidase [Acidimicrobiia bacterium]|nr:protoporphyrinogen oxidase [Acidimicrobiia bacterium]
MTGRTPDIATLVVGAGIAGLAAAVEALEFGDVLVVEASGRVGGMLRSTRAPAGFLAEWAGAAFMLPASGTSTILATIGTEPVPVAASTAASRRWLYTDGRLEEIPVSPPALVSSHLVSVWAKLGALLEPVSKPAPGGEESVAAFLRRRLGAEIAHTFAQPMVSGIFGGDAERLSVDAAFPVLRELEADGGLLRGGLKRMRASRSAGLPRARLHSYADGMETLPLTIAAWLDLSGCPVATGRPVLALEQAAAGRGWRVETASGHVEAERVLLACPPQVTADLLGSLVPASVACAARIRHAPMGIVHLGLSETDLADHVGFGLLAHPDAGLEILGATFDSHLFPSRAPAGGALARVMIGGALHPERVDRDETSLVDVAVRDLGRALGRDLQPVWTEVVRQTTGIPQYELGHAARMRAVNAELATRGDVEVAGWGWRGIGVNGSIGDAVSAVRRLHGEAHRVQAARV